MILESAKDPALHESIARSNGSILRACRLFDYGMINYSTLALLTQTPFRLYVFKGHETAPHSLFALIDFISISRWVDLTISDSGSPVFTKTLP